MKGDEGESESGDSDERPKEISGPLFAVPA